MDLALKNEFAIFRNEEPYKFVKVVKSVERTIVGENYLEEFRWSTDSGVFSSWVKLTGDLLRNLPLVEGDDLYIQNRITNTDDIPISIDGYSYTFEHWTAKELDIQYPAVICDTRGVLSNVIEITSAIFKPYEINPAVCLFNELNYTVNNMFGWDVEYFRTEPDGRTIDPILMEYSLFGTWQRECIKVLVPNNEFPDAKPDYVPMGIEFDMPFEVHIDKKYWQEFFPGRMPQDGDILYFPIERRVYEVSNSYGVKAFMEQELYYAVSLIKYTPKTNRKASPEIQERLDELTTSVEEVFGEISEDMVEDISNPQQFDRYQGSKYDLTRKFINGDINVAYDKINSGNVILMERHYDLSNLTKNSVAIQYIQNATVVNEFGYSSWFNVINKRVISQLDTVQTFALIDDTITFNIDRIRQYSVGDLIEFKRGEIKFLITVLNATENVGSMTIVGSIDELILDDLKKRAPNWSMLGGYQISPAEKLTLLYGYNDTKKEGIEISLLLNRYIIVKVNELEYLFVYPQDILTDTWIGVVVNISNKFKQIDVGLWSINPNENEDGLINIYNETMPIESATWDTGMPYELLASSIRLTNVRIWNQTMQIEKQENILSQLIVNDSHLADVIDNAMPINTLPFIAEIDHIDKLDDDVVDVNGKTVIDISPFVGQDPDMGVYVEGDSNTQQNYNITNEGDD